MCKSEAAAEMDAADCESKAPVELHAFGRWNVGSSRLPDISPFVVKTETLLRITGTPYTRVAGFNMLTLGYTSMSSKNKLPWIRDGETIVEDSHFIAQHIMETRAPDLDAHVSRERRAVLQLMDSTLSNAIYWGMIKHRYTVVGMRHVREVLRTCVPWWGVEFAALWARVSVHGQLWGQGYGRLSDDEVQQLQARDWRAVSELLGDAPYFGGEKPCSFDASAFGFITGVLDLEWAGPEKGLIQTEFKNLVKFRDRMKRRYFPDWEDMNDQPWLPPPPTTK